jgi:hypothetical protein
VKSSEISELEAKVTKAETELQRFTDKAVKVQEASSVIPMQEPAGLRAREGSPSGDRERKLYSEALANNIQTNLN